MLDIVVVIKNNKFNTSLHSSMPKMLLWTVLQQQGMEDFQRASMMETNQFFNIPQQCIL